MNTPLSYFLAFAYLTSVVVQSAPADDYSEVKILDNKYTINPDGSYEFRYILDNGVSHFAVGNIKEIEGKKILVVKGSYSYKTPDGKIFTVDYVADENGYQERAPDLPAHINPKAIATIIGGG